MPALSDNPGTAGSEKSNCTEVSKKSRTSNKDGDCDGFKPGDCAFVYTGKAVNSHILCRVV